MSENIKSAWGDGRVETTIQIGGLDFWPDNDWLLDTLAAATGIARGRLSPISIDTWSAPGNGVEAKVRVAVLPQAAE